VEAQIKYKYFILRKTIFLTESWALFLDLSGFNGNYTDKLRLIMAGKIRGYLLQKFPESISSHTNELFYLVIK